MGRVITLNLKGIPPSLNKFAGRENSWEYRNQKSEWTRLVMMAIKRQNIRLSKPFEHSIVTITYYFPDNRRHDADNYAGKFLLDGLTRGGVIVDDDLKHITTIIVGDIDRGNPHTVITVQEV